MRASTLAEAVPPALSPEERQLRLNHEAAEWLLRRQQGPWTAADEQALGQWLEHDPSRRAAFEGVNRAWADAAQLRPRAQPRPSLRPAPRWRMAVAHLAAAARAWSRGPALGAALAAVLCLGLMGGGYAWHQWSNTPRYTLDVATAPGESRSVALPDGSRIDLNTQSTLRVRYYAQRREVVLDRGEAFFQVARDAGKPFTVDSGASRVRVLGTAFNVHAAPSELLVQVQEGRVEVRADRHRSDAQALVMGPGAGVAIDPATRGHRVLPTAAGAVGEWRSGQVLFRKVPLATVAQELSRYLGVPVWVDDAALKTVPISGLLGVREPERFLLALPSLIDARVERKADGHWHIVRP
jgi:transmembrane sensor